MSAAGGKTILRIVLNDEREAIQLETGEKLRVPHPVIARSKATRQSSLFLHHQLDCFAPARNDDPLPPLPTPHSLLATRHSPLVKYLTQRKIPYPLASNFRLRTH